MTILALSVKGKEFMYDPTTARQVSKASAAKIRDVANENKYLFKGRNDVTWYLHDIDKYDQAYIFAETQKFSIYRGIVKDKQIRYW